MPKTKQSMPTQDQTRRSTTIQDRIASAAHMFTQEILVILGSSTLAELTEVSQDGTLPVVQDIRVQAKKSEPRVEAPKPKKRVLDFLKVIGRMPVQCPVKGCTNRGVRSKMNFCAEHSVSVPKEEQDRLRELQKAEHEKHPTLPQRGTPGPKPKAKSNPPKRAGAAQRA